MDHLIVIAGAAGVAVFLISTAIGLLDLRERDRAAAAERVAALTRERQAARQLELDDDASRAVAMLAAHLCGCSDCRRARIRVVS